ncbi:hypothetical protein ACFQU2_22335 [Siccirubricoccus deserti]
MSLYDIPAHLPFLDCLADGVLRQVPGDAPERLSRTTILLPTRRSARALRVAFLRAADGRALLLPRMRALAGLSTEDADELALPALLDLPPAVEPLRRQAVLTGFVQRLPRDRGGAATPEQAWSLAGALATLLDEIALEEKDLDLLAESPPEALNEHWLERLQALVPETHAQHWQITLTFLRGVMGAWQGWLETEGLLDIGMRRAQALRAQTRAWEDAPPADPVIAAGIGVGGTIPAAAGLLRVVAHLLPQGCVVLHGVDRLSAEAVWDAIREAPTHPYCGQQRLLQSLGATREDVRPWPGCAAAAPGVPEGRPELLGMALRPAAGLPAWQSRRPAQWRAAMQGLSLLVAPDAQAEAAAIALSLREALEDPKAHVALVTPDRDLARRVTAELARHGVAADDSAGEPLGQTPAGAFLRLLARMVATGFAPVPLLAALKHPLRRRLAARPLGDGGQAAGARGAAWAAPGRGAGGAARGGAGRPLPRAGCRGAGRGDGAARPADRSARQLRPPAGQPGPAAGRPAGGASGGGRGVGRHRDAARRAPPLWRRGGGAGRASRLAGPGDGGAAADGACRLAGAVRRHDGRRRRPSIRGTRGRDHGPHPRVEILGLLEARLLTFDRVVLGALDETVWPLATDPGPWMSRPMRRDFGLPEPEARIGRVCADFLLAACAAPEAVLSRAGRRGGAPPCRPAG